MENKNVRQVKKEGLRRWFSDEFCGLIAWYDDSYKIDGFQLCYNKNKDERALTWMANGSYRHNRIDNGEIPVTRKMTPVLIPDGVFNKEKIAALCKKEAKSIDKKVRKLVYHKILEYE